VIHRLQLYCFWFLLIAQRGVQVRDLKRRLPSSNRRQRPREAVKAKPAILGESVRSDPARESLHKSELRLGTADRYSGRQGARTPPACAETSPRQSLTDGAGNPPQRVSQIGSGLI